MNTSYARFIKRISTITLCIAMGWLNIVHAEPGFGNNVDNFCAGKPGFENPPVFGGANLVEEFGNCVKCHNPADKGEDQTPAFQLYKDNKNGPYTALCDYIAPTTPPPATPPPATPPPPMDACDKDGDGYCPNQGDCSDDPTLDPNAALIHPGAPEVCGDGIDNNCNGFESLHDDLMMQDPNTCPAACIDLDGDKFSNSLNCGPMDCDDSNSAINPGAAEMCSDNLDNNCNLLVDSADPSCLVMDDYAKLQELKASLKAHKKACKEKEKQIKNEMKALKKKIERDEDDDDEDDDEDEDEDEDDDDEDEENEEDEDDD